MLTDNGIRILLSIMAVLGFAFGYLTRMIQKPKRKWKLPNALCTTLHDEAARISAATLVPFESAMAHLKNCMVHDLYCPLKDGGKAR